jgi:hypothetical protein
MRICICSSSMTATGHTASLHNISGERIIKLIIHCGLLLHMIHLHVILICGDVTKMHREQPSRNYLLCNVSNLQSRTSKFCVRCFTRCQVCVESPKSFQMPASTCSKLCYITQGVATPNEISSVCLKGKNLHEHQSKPYSKISHKLQSTLMWFQLL